MSGKGRSFLRFFGLFLWRLSLPAAVLVAGMAFAGFAYVKQLGDQPGKLAEPTLIIVKPGDGDMAIGWTLWRAGLISDRSHYDYYRWYQKTPFYNGPEFQPKIGEYQLMPEASLEQTLAQISTGLSYQRRLTILEGWRSQDVIAALNEAPMLQGIITRIPPEGSLFPDTYFYSYGMSRADLVQKMTAKMEMQSALIWAERADDLPLQSRDELIILASMIEKETGKAGERGLVASVFENRLRQKMRLQSDPTVAYGLAGDGPLPSRLTRRDLKKQHGWNTYRIKGLPKTPIANPGLAALQAAANPQASDYLYFVADGQGGHFFAKTLDAHNRNVQKYRKTEAYKAQQ